MDKRNNIFSFFTLVKAEDVSHAQVIELKAFRAERVPFRDYEGFSRGEVYS